MLGLELQRAIGGGGERRLAQHADLILGDAAHDRDRIEQLLAAALERHERGLGTLYAGLGREVLELAARIGDRVASIEQIQIEVLQLDQADLLVVGALVLGLLADRVDLVGGDVLEHAGLRDHATLAIREVRQARLLGERVGATGLLDLDPRGARVVEHRALLLDQLVEASLELALGLPQLIADRLHSRPDDREVRLGVLVIRAEPRRIREPRRRLLCEIERLLQIGVFTLPDLVRVRRVGEAEVVGRTEPQLGIHPRGAARLEELLLRALEVALRERRDALVIDVARGAVFAATCGEHEREQPHHEPRRRHVALRSPALAPTHSAPSRNTSEASTNHANFSTGMRRTALASASRMSGVM